MKSDTHTNALDCHPYLQARSTSPKGGKKHIKIAGARIWYPLRFRRHIGCGFFFFFSKIKSKDVYHAIGIYWGWLTKCKPPYLFRIKVFGLDSCYCFLHISFIATKGNIVRKDVSYEFNNISFLSIDMLISYNVD